MIQKRYQYYKGKEIVWTKWFDVTGEDKNLKTIQKENKYQLSPHLLNEFRIAPVEEKKEKKLTKKKK